MLVGYAISIFRHYRHYASFCLRHYCYHYIIATPHYAWYYWALSSYCHWRLLPHYAVSLPRRHSAVIFHISLFFALISFCHATSFHSRGHYLATRYTTRLVAHTFAHSFIIVSILLRQRRHATLLRLPILFSYCCWCLRRHTLLVATAIKSYYASSEVWLRHTADADYWFTTYHISLLRHDNIVMPPLFRHVRYHYRYYCAFIRHITSPSLIGLLRRCRHTNISHAAYAAIRMPPLLPCHRLFTLAIDMMISLPLPSLPNTITTLRRHYCQSRYFVMPLLFSFSLLLSLICYYADITVAIRRCHACRLMLMSLERHIAWYTLRHADFRLSLRLLIPLFSPSITWWYYDAVTMMEPPPVVAAFALPVISFITPYASRHWLLQFRPHWLADCYYRHIEDYFRRRHYITPLRFDGHQPPLAATIVLPAT